MLLLLLMAAVLMGAKKSDVPEVIQARKIEIVNEQGQVVVSLKVHASGGGQILTRSTNGKPLFAALPNDFGDGVILNHGRNGDLLHELNGTKGDYGLFAIYDSKGKRRLAVTSNKTEAGIGITTFDDKGKPIDWWPR